MKMPDSCVRQPLAIVSMACRLPGGSTLEEFWRLVRNGDSAIRELPSALLNRDLHYDPEPGAISKTYSRIAGLVKRRPPVIPEELLDPAIIGSLDGAHVALLEVVLEAIARGGWDPRALPTRKVGVFVGHTRGTTRSGELVCRDMISESAAYLKELPLFQKLAGDSGEAIVEQIIRATQTRYAEPSEIEATGGLEAHNVARLINASLNLDGPYMAMNAACASSLYALAAGAMALWMGDIKMAIIGGASHCKVESLMLFSKAGSVSATGSCPFDAAADGFVSAEGYVVVMLKTLRQALADGDRIEAVIRGVGFASDGRGKSLWAPRHEGQIEAIGRAYGGHLRADRVQYLEAHATSTPVGDSTEMLALAHGVGSHFAPGHRAAVGSVKANIGHTLESAGLAGLVKTVLALQAKEIPPTSNVTRPNPKIDWANLPFDLPPQVRPWPALEDGLPRRAGVNSFGIGGLNAHLVVDEYVPAYAERYFESETPGATSLQAFDRRVGEESRGRVTPAASSRQEPGTEPLAIVGIGAILPGALTWEQFWQRTLQGEASPVDVPSDRFRTDLLAGIMQPPRGFYVQGYQYDWKKHKVPPKQIQQADPLQFMLLDAVDQALRDGGFHDKPFDRKRTGVIVGSIFGGEFGAQLQVGFRLQEFFADLRAQMSRTGASAAEVDELCAAYQALFLQRMPALVDETGSFTSSTLASRCTKTFDLMGGATAIDCGGASGLAAVQLASWMLRSGETDMMIVGSGHRSAGYKSFQDLNRRGCLAKDGRLRPLATPGRTLPAEGVGVLILKRLSTAMTDGDAIHSVIRSVAASSGQDYRESVCRAVNAVRSAPAESVEQVSLVELAVDNAGGRGLQLADGVAVALNESENESPPLHLRAVSDSVGALGGATSMVAMLRAAESVRQGDIAPLLNPPSELTLSSRRSLALSPVAQKLARGSDGLPTDTLAVGSVDGRLAYAALFSPVERVLRPAGTSRDHEQKPSLRLLKQSEGVGQGGFRVALLAADTISELLTRLEEVGRNPASHLVSLDQLRTPRDRFRVAIVAHDGDELAAKIQPAWRGLQLDRNAEHLAVQGIFIGRGDQHSRVAFCFPGQGSQYPEMFRDWIAADAEVAATVKRFDEILEQLKLPSFHQITVDQADMLGHDVFRTQLSVLLGAALMLDQLQRWGAKPDAVIGHSFGEFAAMLAAGVWDLATAIQATKARCQAIASAAVPESAMTSLLASSEVAQQWVDRIGGDLWVANRNAPEQTVVGGRIEPLDRLEAGLRQAKIKFKRLKVPCAFHTPLLSRAQPYFAQGLGGLRFMRPQVALLSTVTGDYVAEPERLRDGLVAQLVAPVRYQESMERLLAEGFQGFVEIGPSQGLSGLNRRIAAGQAGVISISSDQPGRDWTKSLAALRAWLVVQGLDQASSMETRLPTVRKVPARPVGTERRRSVGAPLTNSLVPVLEVSGTPREMGRQYGEANREGIVDILTVAAGTFGLQRKSLPALKDVIGGRNDFWDDEDWEELCGVAEGAGVTVENVAALNYWLYPDIDSGCAHFIKPCSDVADRYWHGANVDLPLGMILGGPFAHPVVIRHPEHGLTYAHAAMIGQIGSITGMNAAGLSLSSSMLLDRPVHAGAARGRLHGLLVGAILRRADSIEQALEVLNSARRRGAWGLLLSDMQRRQQLYVEYDGELIRTRLVEPSLTLATNHSQLLPPLTAPVTHSERRFQRLKAIFTDDSYQDTLVQTQRALRDRLCYRQGRIVTHPTMDTLRRVDNQASVILSPHQGKIWVAVSAPTTQHYRDQDVDEHDPTPRPDDHFVEVDLQSYGWRAANVADSTTTESIDPVATAAAPQALAEPANAWLTIQRYAPLIQKPLESSDDYAPSMVCQRFVNRMVAWPTPEVDQGPLQPIQDDVLVAGEGLLATAMMRRLAALGVPATQIKPSDPAVSGDDWPQSANPTARHLILAIGGHAEPMDLSHQPYCRSRTLVDWTFRLCQHWYRSMSESHGFNGASCLAVFSADGSFGGSGTIGSMISGAVAGLVKAMRTESHMLDGGGLHAQVIDVHPQIPVEQAADLVIRNLAARRGELEIGYDAQQSRGLLRSIPQPTTLPVAEEIQPDGKAGPSGAWVITGGARGVTAAVVETLAQRFSGPFHLIGASPSPEVDPQWLQLNDQGLKELRARVMREAASLKQSPAEGWARVEKAIEISRNLERMRARGIDCHYWSCDVSDRQAVSELVQRIRCTESIVGVIHGAGFEKATKFASKKWRLVQRTIQSKVDGCAALMEATAEEPLRFFITFGSISGRFGGVGQADYCLANEMQAKLVRWYSAQRPETRVVNIAWHAWDEVGMAARPETRNSPLLADFVFMSVREGVRHFMAELENGDPDAEVTITLWDYYKRFHPDVPRELCADPEAPALQVQTPRHSVESRLLGKAVVLGDNADARQLAAVLKAKGVSTTLLPWGQLDEPLEGFRRALQVDVPEHLIIATGRDDDAWRYASRAQWQQRLREAVLHPAQAIQLWLNAAAEQQKQLESLSALVCLGGDFASKQQPPAPQGAALTAMLRAFAESSQFHSLAVPGRIKAFDASIDVASQVLAEAWVDEFQSNDPRVDVVVTKAGRRAPDRDTQAVESDRVAFQPAGQTWVAIVCDCGASKGLVTELALRFGCKLHAICQDSVISEADSSVGNAVAFHQCELTNRAALQSILKQIRRADGDLQGVVDLTSLTGCLLSGDGNPPEEIVLQLTLVRDLIELTLQDPIRVWIHCGHELEPRFAGAAALLMSEQPEGCGRLQLNLSGPVASEDGPDRAWTAAWADRISRNFIGNLPFGVSGELASAEQNSITSEVRHRYQLRGDEVFLREHRFRNTPLMPMVVSIEWLVRAAVQAVPGLANYPLQLQNVRVVNRLPVPLGSNQPVEVVATETADGAEAVLRSDLITRSGQHIRGGRVHVRGRLQSAAGAAVPAIEPPEFATPGEPWFKELYSDTEMIFHGAPFRMLQCASFHQHCMWGKLVMPDATELLGQVADQQVWTPMAILDASLFLAGLAIWHTDQQSISMPVGIDSLTIWRVPKQGETLVAWAGNPREEQQHALVDFSVWDSSARPVLVAKNYRCAVLRHRNP